jgi:hypothetical protein
MVEKALAEELLSNVRELFAKGYKSSNKFYTDDLKKITEQQNGSKQQKRNVNALEAESIIAIYRSECQPKTTFEAGEYVLKDECRAGNCGEMAVVAIHLAIKRKLLSDNEDAFLWTLSAKGGFFQEGFSHSVAFLGQHTDDDKWIGWMVDPWCNICCAPEVWPTETKSKLEQWGKDGKRIMIPGKHFAGPKYYPTSHEAVMAILEKGEFNYRESTYRSK